MLHRSSTWTWSDSDPTSHCIARRHQVHQIEDGHISTVEPLYAPLEVGFFPSRPGVENPDLCTALRDSLKSLPKTDDE